MQPAHSEMARMYKNEMFQRQTQENLLIEWQLNKNLTIDEQLWKFHSKQITMILEKSVSDIFPELKDNREQ